MHLVRVPLLATGRNTIVGIGICNLHVEVLNEYVLCSSMCISASLSPPPCLLLAAAEQVAAKLGTNGVMLTHYIVLVIKISEGCTSVSPTRHSIVHPSRPALILGRVI